MEKLIRFEQSMTRFLEILITIVFFIILCITNILVIMRYGFNSSIMGGNETMNYLFIYTTALGASVAIGRGDHISISYLVDKVRGKVKTLLNIIKYVIVGVVNAVMLWYSLPWIRSAGSFKAPTLQISMWIVQIIVPVGCALAIIYCLIHIIRQFIERSSDGKQEVPDGSFAS
jgi:TRAP-type C4-dicarboxylate transport system permease small subunit